MVNRTKFTITKKARFLELIANGHTVKAAAEAVGISRQTIWDQRQADPAFAAEYEAAYEDGTQTFEEEMRRRAVDGVTREKGVYHQGEMIGREVITEYSDTLMIFALKSRRPEAYRERSETVVKGDPDAPLSFLNIIPPKQQEGEG